MTATKPKGRARLPATDRRTWAEVIETVGKHARPIEHLIARTELMQALQHRDVSLTERSLMEWERIGLLPTGVVQMHEGRVQATYPWWWPALVSNVHLAIQMGGSRAQAKHVVQTWMTGRSGFFTAAESDMETIHAALRNIVAAYKTEQMPRADEIAAFRMMIADETGAPIFAWSFRLPDSDSHTNVD